MRQIALQHALDGARRILGLDVAVDFARQRRVRTEAAADQDVIALDGVAILRCPATLQASRPMSPM